MMDRDVRIMTLQKQHYMDKYPKSMDCDYSGWGYFDGISFSEIDPKEDGSNLFEKTSKAVISPLWHASGRQMENMHGTYGAQNIGMFRFFDSKYQDENKKFWEVKNYPYIGIAFIQIKDRKEYSSISDRLEKDFTYNRKGVESKTYVYLTYDNADLVVIMKGNSLTNIKSNLYKLSYDYANIIYIHTIVGVSELFLEEFKKGISDNAKCTVSSWKGKNYGIDEEIEDLTIALVSNGSKEFIDKFKVKFSVFCEANEIKFKENPIIKSKLGHGNFSVFIKNTTVATLLKLVCKDGFGTHQNPLYGDGLYNIETSFVTKNSEMESSINIKKLSKSSEPTFLLEPEKDELYWCEEQMKKYSKVMQQAWKDKNENLYAYFQSLLQTLNALSQYERFSMAKDVFYLIAPSFKMFLEQLDEILVKLQPSNPDYSKRMKTMMDAIKYYLESVNAILQHVVHTDQTFLMIPGQAGTDYAIPIKLMKMYYWLIHQQLGYLNDNNYKYECILLPVMESRPSSEVICLDENNRNRLIRIRISMRTLYKPRHLMLIISHEIAHYVGDNTRRRDLRRDNIIRAVSLFVAEEIWPSSIQLEDLIYSKDKVISNFLKEELAKRINITPEKLEGKEASISYPDSFHDFFRWIFSSTMASELKKHIMQEVPDKKFYATETKSMLIGKIYEMLSQDDGAFVTSIISSVADVIWKFVEEEKEKDINIGIIREHIRKLENKRRELCGSTKVRLFLNDIFRLYKEIYSDLVAKLVLDFTFKEYLEAYNVSEGFLIPINNRVQEHYMRKWLMYERFFKSENWPYPTGPGKSVEESILDQIYEYYPDDNITDDFKEYVKQCKEALDKHIKEMSDSAVENQMKTFYKMFGDGSKTADDIYRAILEKGEEYEKVTLSKIRE